MGVECPKCKAENTSDSEFCKKCATPLPSSKEIPVTETLETPKEELATGSTFTGRYQIIEELGKGGMGKVYRVLDKELKEEVALKLIRPEIASDKKTLERFRNELKLARKISHKNVGRMYELMEEKGTRYITMEYIPGEDLKRLIRKVGQFSAGKTVSIAKQVCEGLAEAHRLGVVHRDLKPQNIMVDEEGNARILDFGIARSIKAKGITGAGVMIGTPEYMSPEQAEVKEVDQRSDIYSLGVILYEMVTGRAPFEGETPLGIAMKHKSQVPKDPKEINAQIPEDLSRVILKCLEKDKDNRYQSAGEVRSELTRIEQGLPTTDRVIPKRKPITSKEITVTFGLKKFFIPFVAVVVLIILAFVLWHSWSRETATSVPSSKPSIAVLPFEDLSQQKDQEYFCDGLADELINKLTKVQGLRVPARTSSFSFKGKDVDIQEIGNRLNVEAVLEGSLRKSENKLRITVRLINTADSRPLWAEMYERDEGEIFALQDEISMDILDNLKIKLLGEEKSKIVKHHTENTEAYQFYLKGRFFWNKRTGKDLRIAIEYFEKAIEVDPHYVLAYIGLADTYNLLPFYSSFPPKEASLKSKGASLKALEIDKMVAEAHASLAWSAMSFDWDWARAKTEFERAIELNPNYATAHHWYAHYPMWRAQFEEALLEIKRALELDPLSLIINKDVGTMLYYARQYDKAEEALNKTLEMDQNFYYAHAFLGLVYLQKSMYEEALVELRKGRELSKGWDLRIDTWIGITYMGMGEVDKGKAVLDDLLEKSKDAYVAPYFLASLYFNLGEKDQGFKWLNRAYETHDHWLVFLKVDQIFDSVRSDLRFKAILEKIGLD